MALLESTWNEILSQVDKVSPAELARKYNVTAAGIHYQIKKRGIPYKPFVQRKYQFNEDFFETIDNEHKAYWLGFIMADGCIEQPTKYGNPKRLKIQLSAVDKEHLQKFLDSIESTSIEVEQFMPHESTYGKTSMCRIQINSVKICSDLAKYGITLAREKLVPNIPEHLMRHFIRGYFDGDGSVYESRDKLFISFSSSHNLLLRLSQILVSDIDVSNVVEPRSAGMRNDGSIKHSYTLSYGRQSDVINFYHYIYDNSSIYLERKYVKYTKLLS